MTHSDKAAEIVGNLTDTLERWDGSTNAWAAIIAAALREAETAAYEKAAQVADEKAAFVLSKISPVAGDEAINTNLRFIALMLPDVAEAIRALKTESNPQQ